MSAADLLRIAAGCVLLGLALLAATVWLPCHSLTCAHLTTPHDPSPTGPVCRGCGTTNGGHQ